MCWSLEVSVLTGVVSWIVAAYLIRRNIRWDRASAIFLMATSSMQFADAFLWWDGMELNPDGTCSMTNHVVSVILIPLILRSQLIIRQTEMRFQYFKTSVLILLGSILTGMYFFPVGPWSPSLAWYYFANRACSTRSPFEHSSPLWGGINMPLFCFVIYYSVSIPPMFASGRAMECILHVVILASALSFQDAWSSKFCSIACTLSIWYLIYPGPRLPKHLKGHKKQRETKITRNPFLKYSYAYEKFCFGSAKKNSV